MRRKGFLASVVAAALAGTAVAILLPHGSHTHAAPSRAAVAADLAHLPLAFEQNAGQADRGTRFLTRQAGYDLLIGARGSRMVLAHGHVLGFRTLGSNARATVSGGAPLPGRVNYFEGRSAAAWHTDIATYGRVDVHRVYPGVDLTYAGRRNRVEYTFTVAAGADPAAIRLGVSGARALQLDAAGNLVVHTPAGKVVERAPVAYQTVDGHRRHVDAAFALHGDTVSFALARYDRGRPVIIDPVLTYSTYLGGDNGDGQAYGVAVTAGGNIVVAGSTTSPTFPATSGGSYEAGVESFVTELDPSGASVIYSTYLGGSARDQATAVALDSAGNAYIAGYTDSLDFPLQAAAPSTNDNNVKIGQNLDAFVTELNPFGNALVYSTIVGGSGQDEAQAIAVDSHGAAYITGLTSSTTNFPTTAGAYDRTATKWSAFVTKLAPAGADPERIEWSTYLGGDTPSSLAVGGTGTQALTEGLAVAVDGSGNAYVGGLTLATDFPTTSGAYSTSMGTTAWSSGFVSKLSADGSTLAWSTYLGGTGNSDRSQVTGLALAGSTVVAAGSTDASDFPTSAHALQATPGGGSSDAFVAELKPATRGAGQLAYSTYLGGNNADYAEAVAVTAKGDVYVTGETRSPDFPTAHAVSTIDGPPALTNAFVARLAPSKAGTAGLVWSSYLGGGGDIGLAIALGGSGGVFVVGQTPSASFPTVNALRQAPSSFGKTGFLAEIQDNTSSHLLGVSPVSGSGGSSVTISGVGFTGATAVKFGGVSAAFTVNSDTTISATVPALAVDGNVTVTTPGGTTNGVAFDVVPVISSFTPTDGGVGQVVQITGLSLVKPTLLKVGGVKVGVKTVTAGTALSFVVPATAISGEVAITTANGVADSSLLTPSAFTVDASLAGLTPTKGVAGTTITISGHGLGSTTSVDFTGAPGQAPTSVTATAVKVKVPGEATAGPLTVHTGAFDLATAAFTPLPKITGYDQASYQDGEPVTIEGTNLDGATFKLGTLPLSDSGGSDATHFFTAVPSDAVTNTVTATVAAGKATGPKLLVRPTIISLSVPDGATGTVLTIDGETFTGTKSVLFAGAAGPAKVAAKFTVSSPTQLKVTVPAAAVTGPIAVTNAGGMESSGAFIVDPAITSFTPATGGAGTKVTVKGSGFAPGEQASVGGTDATSVTVTSSTALSLVVPGGVTSGTIEAWTDPAHKAESASPFTVTFSGTALEQDIAPAGSRITIDGVGLTGVTSVHFDDAGTPVAVAPASIAGDGSSLTVIVPSTGDADGVVGLYKSASSHTAVPGTFTRLALDAPDTIAAPGDTLTLSGNGFAGALVKFLDGWTPVWFSLPNSVNAGGTVLTVTVPSGFTGGEVQVVPPAGTGYLVQQPLLGLSKWTGHVGDPVTATENAGLNFADVVTVGGVGASLTGGTSSTLDFAITSGENTGIVDVGGTSSTASFVVEPEVTDVSPASGPTGITITLSGDHLANITNATFASADVTSTITGNTASQLTITVPNGFIDGGITVTNADGTAFTSYEITLAITGVSPGDAAATASVVITGIGFTGASGVSFNGTSASYTVDSDTQITATVPNGATSGPITVAAPAGIASSAGSFTVDP